MVWQQVLALDARYNTYRQPHNPNMRTLYIRRRTQLMRENRMTSTLVRVDGEAAHNQQAQLSFQKQYLKLRSQLLALKYGVHLDQPSIRSRSLGAYSNSRTTLEANDLENDRFEYRSSSDAILTTSLKPRSESLTSKNYSVAGVYHIFDNHKAAVNCVKFAHNDKSLLACSSADSRLSICQLTPSPATVLYSLEGHQKPVTGLEWSLSNDVLLSSSLDGTVRMWDAATGTCMRVVQDLAGKIPILCCTFQPLNNNMVVTGNNEGLVQVINISTGIYLKGGKVKSPGAVLCMTFDSTGRILWVGDRKGNITAHLFDLSNGKLTKGKRHMVYENRSITCLSTRPGYESSEPLLLANCAANLLLLFSVHDGEGSLKLKRKFQLKHDDLSLLIRSAFCPIMSFRHGTYVVSGSADSYVYIFDVNRLQESDVQKLQGHSAPVLDVSFNYDESLLASSDMRGVVIVWTLKPR